MEIVEDEITGDIVIDGEWITGFIHEDNCNICNHFLIYNDKYDAFFCPQCNIWTEECCSDATCMYCKERPAKPLKNRP